MDIGNIFYEIMYDFTIHKSGFHFIYHSFINRMFTHIYLHKYKFYNIYNTTDKTKMINGFFDEFEVEVIFPDKLYLVHCVYTTTYISLIH